MGKMASFVDENLEELKFKRLDPKTSEEESFGCSYGSGGNACGFYGLESKSHRSSSTERGLNQQDGTMLGQRALSRGTVGREQRCHVGLEARFPCSECLPGLWVSQSRPKEWAQWWVLANAYF